MNTAVFYDFETNGMPLFTEPSSHPDQPHMTQVAALLVDLDACKTISTIDLMIRPDGWEIPQDVIAIHGYTREFLMDVGIPERVATTMLLEFVGDHVRVGHIESFDARIMRIALKRYFSDVEADIWKSQPSECTGKLSRDAMSAKKMPKLAEAYQHYCGKELIGAHNALIDAQACRDVYLAVKGYQDLLKAAA